MFTTRHDHARHLAAWVVWALLIVVALLTFAVDLSGWLID